MKILIIGGGNMGLSYAQSFIRSRIAATDHVMILEKNPDKLDVLVKKNIGHICQTGEDCIPHADLIILAVKPQDSTQLFAQMAPLVDEQQVVLSIMAGVQMCTIEQALKLPKIIRAMPNLPAQLGMGMTLFTSSDAVTRLELTMVQNLLNATGKTLYVEKESMIDAGTAVSGSGPAYVFYFMKAIKESAKHLGFTSSEAELLMSQTFKGAVDLYLKSDESCEDWIKKVSSRGGTTEAAFDKLKREDVYNRIQRGVDAAFVRACELGRNE